MLLVAYSLRMTVPSLSLVLSVSVVLLVVVWFLFAMMPAEEEPSDGSLSWGYDSDPSLEGYDSLEEELDWLIQQHATESREAFICFGGMPRT